MQKGRGRDPRGTVPPTPTPTHHNMRLPAIPHNAPVRPSQTPQMHRTPLIKPEPDYEVVEFPSDQYVNAKLQPPPPPPPRPPTGHPAEAGASCGLCGGGGARVRCAECGRRALCASCDDMYHRHPKRRNHQRQAISLTQMRDERPPLPPKATAPVPPPRRHKMSGDRMSASPRPPSTDQYHPTLDHMSPIPHGQPPISLLSNHAQHARHQIPLHLQAKLSTTPIPSHIGSMPYLSTTMHHAPTAVPQSQGHHTLGHMNPAWNRPRGSLQAFNFHQPPVTDSWDPDGLTPTGQGWSRPLRRGASVLELGGGTTACGGCAQCPPAGWRYGSCANLDHPWQNVWQPTCCVGSQPSSQAPHHETHLHTHPNHVPHTPQPHRRTYVESRTASRAASRAGSPAVSIRSRTVRRNKHRTPSPPSLPSSDADSENDSEKDVPLENAGNENSLGPIPPPSEVSWQCEHCTFVNEPGVRVCVVCCRTPTVAPRIIVSNIREDIEKIKITVDSTSAGRSSGEEARTRQNGTTNNSKSKKNRASTGCGPSPPREEKLSKTLQNQVMIPSREQSEKDHTEHHRERHDMAVGPSPPREIRNCRESKQSTASGPSPPRETSNTVRVSPYRDVKELTESPKVHTISVGPSPPRDNTNIVHTSTRTSPSNPVPNVQKKSTGTSPPTENPENKQYSLASIKTNVSNTGTSPPPQSISTQTYEAPSTWERAPSASRSRPRRRFRDDTRRERSHSRHSVSSDTRDSDLSVRTVGTNGRWEWRDRSPGGEWSETNRISRRASHLDLRRNVQPHRRSGFYGSEAASPEPGSTNRAGSIEALAGAGGRREAERGLELARLMADAERLGFSAAEVQAALAQSPAAPLAWLRSRWPSLCAGVRAAAARLAPDVSISELETRAALARHRGAMWPAVTDCIERYRRQTGVVDVSVEGRLRGRVWGSPAGADDDAAPRGTSHHSSRVRAEDSSDEYEAPLRPKFRDDDWMYLPLDVNVNYKLETDRNPNLLSGFAYDVPPDNPEDIRALTSKNLNKTLIDENLLQNVVSDTKLFNLGESADVASNKLNPFDLVQSENDFIDAYNALAKTNPLPNIKKLEHNSVKRKNSVSKIEKDTKSSFDDENLNIDNRNIIQETQSENVKNVALKNSTIVQHLKKHNTNTNSLGVNGFVNLEKQIATSNIITDKELHPTLISLTANQYQRKEKTSKENNYDGKSEENTKKLNDIVDNTQKLIQQMKEEINSDINSLDSRNISDSEHESSSNDEQESSYSGTESETDNITSDEHEASSLESEEIEKFQRNPILTQRTSSEDNEQFEEALDNLENQIDDYKHANIEILDTIARSLQEGHNFENKATENCDLEKQDSNNNIYNLVSSFEEIYEELSSPSSISVKNQQQIISNTNQETVSNVLPHIDLLPKQTINFSSLKFITPTKIILTENKQPIFNAKLEILQENLENIIEELKGNSEEESKITNEELPTLEQITVIEKSHTSGLDVLPDDRDTVVVQNSEELPVLIDKFIDDESTEIYTDTKNRILESQNKNDDNITPENKLELKKQLKLKSNEQSNKILNVSHETVSAIDNSNKTATKSNIPKLIKITHKGKVEKNLPKLIVSKVPIRRTSIKQYPAPAPPKSHFGNIQSGNVKQLQTRLFNGRPKVNANILESVEVKPSTSTMSKKKPAPLPPINLQETKEISPPNPSPPKEKKNYFRETCRTEDEWTESDSEDSQVQIVRSTQEQEERPLSPPPPITLRRVSGQLIDLAKVRLPEGSPERQARMLLAEGAMETWEQAQLAVELVIRGTEPSAALMAALECMDLSSALVYLHQECELCASRLPEHEMVSMLRCTHRCCRECAHHYFTVQITERSIADCVCPYCKAPDLENLHEDAWLEYFAHLDILLKTLLETEVHELFQRKLRDRTLARDPNFKWCMECSSGFFVHPKQKKLRCPECRSISCASCRKPWTTNHEGLTCDEYAAWVEDNDPEISVSAIQQHLRDNGLECPRCHFKYSLSRGGCMHFTCTQCKFEFCYGCGKPFTMGARCGLSEYCAKLGLHAHHPRNCLFYLRDKEPHELQTLLQMNNVQYETNPAEGTTGRCPIQLQRETPTGLVDGTCASEAPSNHAGLCKNHYLEYLCRLVRRNEIDPLPVLGVDDLETLVRRAALRLPPRPYGSLEGLYKRGLIEIVREKIPLD